MPGSHETAAGAAPTGAADGAPASSADAPRPGLVWGIKRSFMRYLSYLPDFAHQVTDGATLTRGNHVRFESDPGSDYDIATGCGTLRFLGRVRLSGHHGMLVVVVADPWLEVAADGAALTIASPAGRTAIADVHLPTFEATGTALVRDAIPARLAGTGVDLFGGQYPPGEELDPLSIVHAVRPLG